MKNTIYFSLFILMPFLAYSQCTVEYWDLEKRINESDLLVEATVLESKSVWDDNHHNIYTLNTLKVYKVFKGELEKDQITLVTMGGTVGLEAHHAHPSLEIQAGQTGIFILSENGFPVQADKGFWMATASYQSLILYDLQRFKAIDSDREFESIRFELYPYISEISKQELKELSPYNPESGEGGIKPLAPSVIDSFSLDTVTGGSGEVLTIYGTNFGFAKGAQGKVGFKDANFGDGRYYYSPVSWTYVSWSNSQIQVYVPQRAGTGIVEVVNAAGESGESGDELFVKWANLNTLYGSGSIDTQFFRQDHTDQNGSGGYTWQMSDQFSTVAGASNSFIRGLETWRCGTNINWKIGQDTSLDETASDNVNIVRFTEFSGNTLGVCWSRASGCFDGSNIYWYIRELDIEFDSTVSWYFGTGTTPANDVDFQTVVTHELGHGQQLGHVRDGNRIMHYSIGKGVRKVDLADYDQEGAAHVMDLSVQANVCGPDPHDPIDSNNCQISVPIAIILSDDEEFCPGDDVVFSSLSEGKVDGYLWNFGVGANPASASTMGPHTVSYTNEGTKSVQLIVQNSFGADTTEMQVTVLPNTPMMPADFLNTDTICTGIANYSILDTLDGIGYYWSISSGGSFVGGQNGSSVQIDWTGSGEHRISVVAGNECGTSAVQEDTLYIVPEPSADFSYSADGLTVDFTIDAENFMDLEWSFGDGGKTNALNPQRQYPDRGTYTVKLKVWNECGADSISKTLELDFPSGISDVQAGITVYPNPVNGEQVLHFGQYIAGHVQILSSTGSEVLNTELFGNFLELPNLPAGVYVIRIQNGNNVTNFKILVLS